MKNLFTILIILLSLYSATSQNGPKPQSAPGYTTVTDTLHYYQNKYYFKSGQTNLSNYPFFKMPENVPNKVAYAGSRFDNSDTVVVTGLEAYLRKGAVSVSPSIPVRIYLCSLNSSGLPVMPPVDSVNVTVGSVTPARLGGNFTTNRTLYSDFAVLARNMSANLGDTVMILRTAGATATNQTASAAEKSSDGNYSFVRFMGQFYSTQNFTMAPGFGMGTEYEFMVAPRVQYRMQASFKIPQIILTANANSDSLCTYTPFTFTNTSSYQFTNRFYNLLELVRKWNQNTSFIASPLCNTSFPADSAVSWYFEYDDVAVPPKVPIKVLPYMHYGPNKGIVTSITSLQGCFPNNEFRARHKSMSPFGCGVLRSENIAWAVCTKFCSGDAVTLSEASHETGVRIYPHPLINGKTTIYQLKGKSFISVYDIAGKLIKSVEVVSSTYELDLSGYEKGIYLCRVAGSVEREFVLKITHQ